MKFLLFIICLLLITVLPCQGQPGNMKLSMEQQKVATAAANKALGELMVVAPQIDPRSIGFDDEKQIRTAKVGVPISDYYVRLDELKEYRSGKPAQEMLHATGRLLFPLEVNNQAKSMAVLSMRQEKWMVESFGGKNQIRMLTELRKRLANLEGRSIKELFQVRIPAMQLLFVGMERGGKLYLSPLTDTARYGFQKGKTYPAEQVLEKLVDAAKKHNGLPT